MADLARTKPQLVAENALLRQQLLILRRQSKSPRCTPTDRALLVLLAGYLTLMAGHPSAAAIILVVGYCVLFPLGIAL